MRFVDMHPPSSLLGITQSLTLSLLSQRPGRQVVEEDVAAVAAHVVGLHAPAARLPSRVYTQHL